MDKDINIYFYFCVHFTKLWLFFIKNQAINQEKMSLILRVEHLIPDEGYSRNVSCALNFISAFLF